MGMAFSWGCGSQKSKSSSSKTVYLQIGPDPRTSEKYALDANTPSFIGFLATSADKTVSLQLKPGQNQIELPLGVELSVVARLVTLKSDPLGAQFFISQGKKSVTLSEADSTLSLSFEPYAKAVPTNLYGMALWQGTPLVGSQVRLKDPLTQATWEIPELSFGASTDANGVFSLRSPFTQAGESEKPLPLVLEFTLPDGKKIEKSFETSYPFLPGTNLKYVNLSGPETIELGKSSTDFDGDGILNLAEEAMGTNPFAVNTSGCTSPEKVLKGFAYTCSDGLSLVGTLEVLEGKSCFDLLGDVNKDGKKDGLDCQGPKGDKGDKGDTGLAGTNGTNGSDGVSVGISIVLEPAGSNCPTGGSKVTTWTDFPPANQIMDSGEASSAQYKFICNGNNAVASTPVVKQGSNTLGNYILAGDMFANFDNAYLQLAADPEEVGKFKPKFTDVFFGSSDCNGSSFVTSSSGRIGNLLSGLVTNMVSGTKSPRPINSMSNDDGCVNFNSGAFSYAPDPAFTVLLPGGKVFAMSGSHWDIKGRRLGMGALVSTDGGGTFISKTQSQMPGSFSHFPQPIATGGPSSNQAGEALLVNFRPPSDSGAPILQYSHDGTNFTNFPMNALITASGMNGNPTCWKLHYSANTWFAINDCSNSGKVFRSTDQGLTWSFSSIPLANSPGLYLYDFHRIAGKLAAKAYTWESESTVTFQFSSPDNGLTWEINNPCLDLNQTRMESHQNILYCLTPGYLFKSTNQGTTWQLLSSFRGMKSTLGLSVGISRPERIIVGGAGLFLIKLTNDSHSWIVSNDSGTTWSQFSCNHSSTNYEMFSNVSWVGNNILAKTTSDQYFLSVDQGVSWNSLTLPNPFVGDVMLTANKIFLAHGSNGFWHSNLSPVSFALQNSGTSAASIQYLTHCYPSLCAISFPSNQIIEIDPSNPTLPSFPARSLGQIATLIPSNGVGVNFIIESPSTLLATFPSVKGDFTTAKHIGSGDWQTATKPDCPNMGGSGHTLASGGVGSYFYCGSFSSDFAVWSQTLSYPPELLRSATPLPKLMAKMGDKFLESSDFGRSFYQVGIGIGSSYGSPYLYQQGTKWVYQGKISLNSGATFTSIPSQNNVDPNTAILLPNGELFAYTYDKRSFATSSDNGNTWTTTHMPIVVDTIPTRSVALPAGITLPLINLSLQ